MCPSPEVVSLLAANQPIQHRTPACVPGDELSQAVYQHSQAHLGSTILAHSLRVFLYTQAISHAEGTVWSQAGSTELALLFTACMFHDMGTSEVYNTGPTRFEIEGGDSAVKFLSLYPQIHPEQAHHVWVAIALHTTPQISNRIHPLARLLRLGPKIDFKGSLELQELANVLGGTTVRDAKVAEIEKAFPRGEIEKVLGDAVVDQALSCPEKAPQVSWPGIMLQSKRENMDWTGVNKAF